MIVRSLTSAIEASRVIALPSGDIGALIVEATPSFYES